MIGKSNLMFPKHNARIFMMRRPPQRHESRIDNARSREENFPMKKITLSLIGAVAMVAAFFGNIVPALSAAPADPGSPKENWKEIFADGLFRADGSKVKLTDAFKNKKFVGIYASASWCAPCRHFTPRLVEFYKEFRDQVEIVLVGCDNTQEEVFKYMVDHGMEWLTVKRDSPGIGGYKARNGIRGIPNFRFYDAKTGKLLVANELNLEIIRRAITGEKSTGEAGSPENWESFFEQGLTMVGGKSVPVETLKKKKFVGIYCADERVPQCAKFTASLAAFYKKNKDKITIVFFTYGKNREEMLSYAKKTKMPWLVMEPNLSEAQRFLMKYQIQKLPDFRIFNAKGKLVLENGTDLSAARKAIGGKK